MKRKGLVIADIHSIVNPIPIYMKEMYQLLERIEKEEDPIDFVILAGDYFDRQMYISDRKGYLSLQMLAKLIMTCIKRKIKLRIVYGTESHEVNQYESMKELEDGIYYRVIHQIEEERLFDDLTVLYIPEEIKTPEEQESYKEFLNKEKSYDFIFGHGVIQESMVMASLMMKKRELPATTHIFHVKDLEESTKGYCIFGHYHVHTKISEKVFYVGSYSRFKFGEEKEKGWMEISHENGIYNQEFVVNSFAPIYNTITLSAQSIEQFTREITTLEEEFSKNPENHYKIKLEISDDPNENQMIYDSIREYRNQYHGITFDIQLKGIEKGSEEGKEIEEQFPILFDPNIGEVDKIHYFCERAYGTDIPTSFIEQVKNQTL